MDERKHTFSFRTNLAVASALNDRVGFCRTHNLRCSEGLVLRALLAHAGENETLVSMIQQRKAAEKLLRREKDKVRQTITFQPTKALARRVNKLIRFCKTSGEKASDGLLVRAVIDNTPCGPHLLGYVRARMQYEREQRIGDGDERATEITRPR